MRSFRHFWKGIFPADFKVGKCRHLSASRDCGQRPRDVLGALALRSRGSGPRGLASQTGKSNCGHLRLHALRLRSQALNQGKQGHSDVAEPLGSLEPETLRL